MHCHWDHQINISSRKKQAARPILAISLLLVKFDRQVSFSFLRMIGLKSIDVAADVLAETPLKLGHEDRNL